MNGYELLSMGYKNILENQKCELDEGSARELESKFTYLNCAFHHFFKLQLNCFQKKWLKGVIYPSSTYLSLDFSTRSNSVTLYN